MPRGKSCRGRRSCTVIDNFARLKRGPPSPVFSFAIINDEREDARISSIPRTAQWPLHSPSRRAEREVCFVFFFSFYYSFFSFSGGDDDALPVRRDAVVATALGRLTAQPDRPIARLLSPSAILPLPEHKDAAEPSAAERSRKRTIAARRPVLSSPTTPATPAAVDRRAFCGFAPSSVS